MPFWPVVVIPVGFNDQWAGERSTE